MEARHRKSRTRRFPRGALALVGAVLLGLITLVGAQANHTTVTHDDAGPVSLSASDHPNGNAGNHIVVGSVELEPGLWEISASVRLVVDDPENETGKPASDQKNSQGCGLFANGTKLGGAGGSSSLWTAFEGGKDVTFNEWWDGAAFHPSVEYLAVTSQTVVLECFIDASHSGVTHEDREGMAATDVSIVATHLGPNDGQDGQDGNDGQDGSDGSDGADGSDGQDGTDGVDGQDGADGEDGEDGEDGTDGETTVVTETRAIETPTRINTGR